MHAEQGQPDDHAGGERRVDGSDGGADEGAALEVQVEEDAGRTSLRDDQAVVRLHALSAQGTGESAVRMESDDAGLQPQTGVEPGELREIDGGGGSESPAKRLNGAGGALFSFVGSALSSATAVRTDRISGKQKPATRTFGPPAIFFRSFRQTFHTASRGVRPLDSHLEHSASLCSNMQARASRQTIKSQRAE